MDFVEKQKRKLENHKKEEKKKMIPVNSFNGTTQNSFHSFLVKRF